MTPSTPPETPSAPEEALCCTHRLFKGNDHAFMGLTHALSGLLGFLLLFIFFAPQIFEVMGTKSLAMLILFGAAVVGGSLIPDLDNTTSTAKNALGIAGDVLSVFFRSTSSVIQTFIRTPRDGSDINPHRGFYHTIPGALLTGFLVVAATHFDFFTWEIPLIGKTTSGMLMAIIFSWACLHLALTALAKDLMRRIKKSSDLFGELIAALISLIIAIACLSQLPVVYNFLWLGLGIALGMVIHSLGDCFTAAGSPILFPVPIKGKLWWTVRFAKIKAGGEIEETFITPLFFLASILAVGYIAFQGVATFLR